MRLLKNRRIIIHLRVVWSVMLPFFSFSPNSLFLPQQLWPKKTQFTLILSFSFMYLLRSTPLRLTYFLFPLLLLYPSFSPPTLLHGLFNQSWRFSLPAYQLYCLSVHFFGFWSVWPSKSYSWMSSTCKTWFYEHLSCSSFVLFFLMYSLTLNPCCGEYCNDPNSVSAMNDGFTALAKSHTKNFEFLLDQ